MTDALPRTSRDGLPMTRKGFQNIVLKMGTEAVTPPGEEDVTPGNIPQKPAANQAVCKDMSLWRSIFIAAVVTTAIALFSSGIVFSRKYDEVGVDLEKRDVKASVEGQGERSLTQVVANKRPNRETRASSGSVEAKSEEEEANRAGKEPMVKLNQEVTGKENSGLSQEGNPLETARTVVVTIQKGDTIHLILKRRYGESSGILLDTVGELNPEIDDLDLIRAGQKLRLPLKLGTGNQIEGEP
jgi:hypothetical protein